MPETHMIGELWFVTQKQRDKYLRVMGYLFEQSIPTHGIEYQHPVTELPSHEILHAVCQGRMM
jgi:hypothetical protein